MRRRLLPALALATFVAGQLASVAHAALVRHAVCADHGEAVHVSSAEAAEVPAHRDDTDAVSGSEPAPADDHEHCSVACERRALARPGSRASIAGHGGDAPRPLRDAQVPPAIAIYRLAPKSSPPAG